MPYPLPLALSPFLIALQRLFIPISFDWECAVFWLCFLCMTNPTRRAWQAQLWFSLHQMEIKKTPPPLLVANRKPADKRALLCHSPSCAGSAFRPQHWQGQRLCQLQQLHGARRKRGEEEELNSTLINGMGSRAPQNNPRRRNMDEGAPYSARRHLECAGGGTTDRLMSGE